MLRHPFEFTIWLHCTVVFPARPVLKPKSDIHAILNSSNRGGGCPYIPRPPYLHSPHSEQEMCGCIHISQDSPVIINSMDPCDV